MFKKTKINVYYPDLKMFVPKSDAGLAMLLTLFVLMVVTSIGMIMTGLCDAGAIENKYQCNSEKSRIEYVLPFYRIGCWLGEVP